jgi:FkbM family methyltransferase
MSQPFRANRVTFAPLVTFRFLAQHPFAMRRPLATAARYLRWQVGSRILGCPVAVEFVNDARLLVRRGMTGATGNVYAGLHDYEEMAFLLHLLREGDLFVDVGANVGTYTVLAAKVSGAHVIAFEPIPGAADALRDNLALNAIESRVEVRRACVGASRGAVQMTTGEDTTNHVVATPGDLAGTMTVPVETLDEVLRGLAPILIKLDVEGYELAVVRGASSVLASPDLRAVLLEMNTCGERYARSDAELVSMLTSFGFERCSYEPRERRLLPVTRAHGRANALFVRDVPFVRERLVSAPPFRVLNQSI